MVLGPTQAPFAVSYFVRKLDRAEENCEKVERGHLRTLLALPGDGRGERKQEGRREPVYQEQEQRGSIIDHLVKARAPNQGARSEANV